MKKKKNTIGNAAPETIKFNFNAISILSETLLTIGHKAEDLGQDAAADLILMGERLAGMTKGKNKRVTIERK